MLQSSVTANMCIFPCHVFERSFLFSSILKIKTHLNSNIQNYFYKLK